MLLYREAEALDPGPSAATATVVFLACYVEQEVWTTSFREKNKMSFALFCFVGSRGVSGHPGSWALVAFMPVVMRQAVQRARWRSFGAD